LLAFTLFQFQWEEPKLLLVQKVHLKDGHSSVASQLLQPHSYCAQIFHLLGGELLFTGAQSETKAMQIEEKDLQPNTVGTPGKIHTINIAKKLKYMMEIQFRSQT
jgi:hypothetical protein